MNEMDWIIEQAAGGTAAFCAPEDDLPETGGEVRLADPPAAVPPPDDLPDEGPGLNWTLRDLQLAVDRNVLPLGTARHAAAVLGLDGERLHDSRTGFAYEDLKKHVKARAAIIYMTLDAYAKASKTWTGNQDRSKSYEVLKNYARDIISDLKRGSKTE